MAVVDTMSVTVQWRFQHGTIGANVLHYGVQGEGVVIDQAFAAEFGGIFGTLFEAEYATLLPATTFMTGLEIRDLRVDPPPVFETNLGGEIQGGSSGDPVTNSLCVCITLRTPHGGRRGRGRVYLPGLSGGSYVDGNWTNSDDGANFLNDVAVITLPVADALCVLGVLSRADNELYGPAVASTRSEVPAVLRTRQDRP